MNDQTPPTAEVLTGDFSVPVSPIRVDRRGNEIEAEEWVSAALRFIGYWGEMAMHHDPAALVHARAIIDRVNEITDMALAMEHSRPKERKFYSLRQLGDIMGTSHVAVLKRIAKGKTVLAGLADSLSARRSKRALAAEREAAFAALPDVEDARVVRFERRAV